MPPDQAGGGYVRQPSPCRPRVSASGSTSCPLIRIVGDPGNRRASASSGLPISVSVTTVYRISISTSTASSINVPSPPILKAHIDRADDRLTTNRRTATAVQIASTTPNGHASDRKS